MEKAVYLGRGENGQPLQSSLTSAYGGQKLPNNIGGNLPSTGRFLLHHAQPFIQASWSMPNGSMPTHIYPYQQPTSFVNGQHLSFPTQTPLGNLLTGGTPAHLPQEGHAPQTFVNSNMPSQNGFTYPANMHTNSYPFYTQPMYTFLNVPMYTNPNLTGVVLNPVGSVTPFVRWIKDYSLPDGLKMPFHIGSYDRKGDPDKFLHLFEGAIRMQKWLIPVACHMFTYTLKDSARMWWNSHKAGSILDYEDLKAKFRSHFSQQKKFTKTHLAVHNIKQREGESTRAFITRYTNDTLEILGLHEEQRISVFVHGLRTRSLVEHLSTDLPSTYKGTTPKDQRNTLRAITLGQRIEDDSPLTKGKITTWLDRPLSNLVKSPREILATEKVAKTFKQPPRFPGANWSKDRTRYYHFHKDYGHETNQCRELRHQIEEAVKLGQLAHLVKGQKNDNAKKRPANHGGIGEIAFPSLLNVGSADPVIIKAYISGRQVNRVYLDGGSSCEVIYKHCFLKLKPSIRSLRVDSNTPLIGFSGEQSWPLGEIPLEITIGEGPIAVTKTLTFVIVKSDSPHNLLLGRTAMQQMGIVVSTVHGAIKFHTPRGIGTIFSEYNSQKPKEEKGRSTNRYQGKEEIVLSCIDTEERVVINDKYPKKMIMIRRQLPRRIKIRLRDLLKKYIDVFAWTSAHITWVPRVLMIGGETFNTEHRINVFNHAEPIKQKKRSMAPERNEVIHSQMGINMEVNADDIVIMSDSEEEMMADITETLERLRAINLKLNPKNAPLE
ncbi:reverse transcriptase domain-containing protein [Tanacetum coccineum]